MTTSSELRVLWAPWYGESAKVTKSSVVSFPGDNRVWPLLVADVAAEAFEHLSQLMSLYQYLFLESAGGTWVVRPIAGTNIPSLHSYGIAIDLNPDANDNCETDMPPEFITDVKSLRTGNGKQVFTWGGDWPGDQCDPMHFQLDVGPEDLETGVFDPEEGAFMAGVDFVKQTEEGPAVRYWQRVLDQVLENGLEVTGVFDDATVKAVAKVAETDGEQIGNLEAMRIHRAWIEDIVIDHEHRAGNLQIGKDNNIIGAVGKGRLLV